MSDWARSSPVRPFPSKRPDAAAGTAAVVPVPFSSTPPAGTAIVGGTASAAASGDVPLRVMNWLSSGSIGEGGHAPAACDSRATSETELAKAGRP